ncbi:hypothetical protein [Methylosinus sporium]|uniref:hypothetical protein n=1 Tax=Methylosinus sporium TaxID=428 RepID=UPI00383B4704
MILSGAYVTSDIAAEFGRLPPAFLPIGSEPLYVRQVAFARERTSIILLTIPADFQMTRSDETRLEDLRVRIVRSPVSLSLATATQFILEALDVRGSLVLLHGDTLVDIGSETLDDVVVVDETDDFYPWADVVNSAKPEQGLSLETSYGDGARSRLVASGLFSFTNSSAFRDALNACPDFISAVDSYGRRVPLRAVKAQRWYDFGSLSRMMRSRREILVSRAFNTLTCDGVSVVKTSRQKDKITAEIAWYEQLPSSMRAFTPHFLGVVRENLPDEFEIGYRLEYLYQPTLAELFVFGRLPRYVWRQIIAKCLEFIEACRQIRPEADEAFSERRELFDSLVKKKSRRRIEDFLATRNIALSNRITLNGVRTPRLEDVLDDLISMIPSTSSETYSLMHGDLFFGNMFYDFRAKRVRVVDPRGHIDTGKPTLWGDWRYDLAKLAHSVHGQYDHILLGSTKFREFGPMEYEFSRSDRDDLKALSEDFGALTMGGLSCLGPEIRAIEGLLFLSMLPMHAEAPLRQNKFFSNGLLIHRELTS